MRKIHLIVFLMLFSTSYMTFASEQEKVTSLEECINFSKEELDICFDQLGFQHFAEKTNITNRLAGEKIAISIPIVIETAYADYDECIKEGMPDFMYQTLRVQMAMSKPLLYERLLKDCPEALAKLEQHGIYKPIK